MYIYIYVYIYHSLLVFSSSGCKQWCCTIFFRAKNDLLQCLLWCKQSLEFNNSQRNSNFFTAKKETVIFFRKRVQSKGSGIVEPYWRIVLGHEFWVNERGRSGENGWLVAEMLLYLKWHSAPLISPSHH